jgi:prolipoprotein diacylglyceryltransferase
MKIAFSNPESIFAFFYVLSFAVTFMLIIIFSIRQKIPVWSVLLMLTTMSLFTIIGSRFITIPVNEWGSVLRSGDYTENTGRSAIGGLLFGLATLLFSVRILGLSKNVLNMYAWIAPIGFGIQKIGCFFNGCCYGKPSDLPWSVQYTTGTSAHFHHFINGIIDEKAAFSLNVHPVQLYEVIFLFGIAYIVWRTKDFWKKSGSSLLFSLLLFFIFRFSLEFLRDPDSSTFNNNVILGVRLFQWVLLILGFVCGGALMGNEKHTFSFFRKQTTAEPSLNKSIIYIISISVIIYIFRRLFTPFELISLDIKFVPAILLTAYKVYQSIPKMRLRLATTSFLLFPLFFISQTLPIDTTRTGKLIDKTNNNDIKAYKRVDFGASFGTYSSSVRYNPHEGQCGTTYSTEDYKYVYQIAGGGYSSVKKQGKSITTTGINLWGGSSKEVKISNNYEKSYFLIGVNPYVKYDLNWIGGGAGVHVGNLRWVPQEPLNDRTLKSGTRVFAILPEFTVRVGRRDILDLKYNYGFNTPTMFPVLMNEFSVGTGFGNKTDYSLRYGVAISNNDFFKFISAEGLVDKRIGLYVKYNFGGTGFYSETVKSPGRILFGLNYRFGFEK